MENLLRITTDADVTHLSGFDLFAQGGNRLVNDLGDVHELDVVAQHDIQVFTPQAVQRHIDALGDAFGGKIEMIHVVTTELRANIVLIARHIFQSDPQQHFAHAPTVKRRRVDEVQPEFERDADRGEYLIQGHTSELRPQGRSTEAQDRQLQIGLPHTGGLASAVRRPAAKYRQSHRARKPYRMAVGTGASALGPQDGRSPEVRDSTTRSIAADGP